MNRPLAECATTSWHFPLKGSASQGEPGVLEAHAEQREGRGVEGALPREAINGPRVNAGTRQIREGASKRGSTSLREDQSSREPANTAGTRRVFYCRELSVVQGDAQFKVTRTLRLSSMAAFSRPSSSSVIFLSRHFCLVPTLVTPHFLPRAVSALP